MFSWSIYVFFSVRYSCETDEGGLGGKGRKRRETGAKEKIRRQKKSKQKKLLFFFCLLAYLPFNKLPNEKFFEL